MARFKKRRSLAVHALGMALLGALGAPAWAATLKVVVRVTHPGDRALLERIRGQTSDLPVELIPVAGDGEVILAQQMVVARELAERHEAGAVVWFTRVPCPQTPGAVTAILVQLSQPALRTVLVHSTGGLGSAACEGAATPLPSHALEEAAIAVRSALSAVANGGIIGVQVPARAADTEVRTAARTPPAPPPVRMLLTAGWLVIRDGVTAGGQQGVEAGAALETGRLQLGLRLSSTFAAEAEDELSAVSLSRGAASVGIGGRLSLASRLSGSAAVHVGLALLSRTTRAREPDVMAAPPSRRLSPLLSPELRLQALLHRELGLALALGVGLDYQPWLPRLVYRREEELQPRAGPGVLQPRLVLAIEICR